MLSSPGTSLLVIETSTFKIPGDLKELIQYFPKCVAGSSGMSELLMCMNPSTGISQIVNVGKERY